MALEQLLIPLSVYAGKKIFDIIFDKVVSGEKTIVDQSLNIGSATYHDGRTMIDRNFTTSINLPDELIFGNLYIPYSVANLLTGAELVLGVIIEEMTDQLLFFTADTEGYEIYLPHGIYSFLVLLVDVEFIDLGDPLDADILAVGLPSAIDLTGIDDLTVEDYDDVVWDLLVDEPYQVGSGGPFYLDFIMLDTLEHPELPSQLWELFGD